MGSTMQAELQELRHKWGWFLVLGIALVLIGLLALTYPLVFTISTVFVFGILLLVSGGIQLISAFSARRWSGVLLLVLSGVLSLVVGVMMVEHPVRLAVNITLFLGAFLMVSGLFRVASATEVVGRQPEPRNRSQQRA